MNIKSLVLALAAVAAIGLQAATTYTATEQYVQNVVKAESNRTDLAIGDLRQEVLDAKYLTPSAIKAGDNVSITTNAAGEVTIAAAGDYAAVSNAAMNAAARVIVVTNYTAATGTTNDVLVCDVDGTVMRYRAQGDYWSGTGTNSYGLVDAVSPVHAPPLVEWEAGLNALGEWEVVARDPLEHTYLFFPVEIGGQPDGVWLDWDTAMTNDVLTGRFDDPDTDIHVGPFHIRRLGLSEDEVRVVYSNDVALTPMYSQTPTFSEWTISPSGKFTEMLWGFEEGWLLSFDEYPIYTDNHDPNATSVSAEDNDGTIYTATRTRTDIVGYTLGSQTDKPLQPKGEYAPATNITKSALAPDVQTSLGKADTALQTTGGRMTGAISFDDSMPVGGICSVYYNEDQWHFKDHLGGVIVTPKYVTGSLALLSDIYAAIQQIAPDFTTKSYVANDLCTYNGVVYRCKADYTATASSPNPDSDTAHWEAKKVSELFLPLTGGAMTGGLTVPNLTVGSRLSSEIDGTNSFAGGDDTTASGYNSHAEGRLTTASGYNSHAEGEETTASGDSSHAEGYVTIAQNDAEHAQGIYNASHNASDSFGDAGNTLSSIGCGTDDNDRKNAVEVMQDGKTYIYGLGGYDGTNPTNATDLAASVNGKQSALTPTQIANIDAVPNKANESDLTAEEIRAKNAERQLSLDIIDMGDRFNYTVPNTREINGHALTADVSLTASDVGAIPALSNVPQFNLVMVDGSGGLMNAMISAFDVATVSGVQQALSAKAPLASPAFTGTPTAPTPASGDNSTNIATTAFVAGAVSGKANLVANATAGNLAALDADGNPVDSGLAKSDVVTKSDVDPLLFAQYYPEDNVKSAAEFTTGIKYMLTSNATERTAMVKPFCNTGDSNNDNSSLVGRIVIPPFVDAICNPYITDDGTRYKVVGVSGVDAMDDANTNLTAIVVPSTVTSIGESAFSACTALTSVTLPTVTTIEVAAFDNCYSLTSISLPAATTIEDLVFCYCTNLTSISLPAATTRIGIEAFYYCINLTSIDFGDTPRSSVPLLDGSGVFYNVPNTCKIIVPYTQYNEWQAADGWRDLPQKFVRHMEKADKPATFTVGNLANIDANGNPTDSGVAKSAVESLFLSQYYPEGNVKSVAEFTPGIRYDAPDTTNRTITVKPFANTDGAADDNSNLSGRVVIPPFVDANGNGYVSDDGTRYKVVEVSSVITISRPKVNSNLISFVAPSTVTGIGIFVFENCSSLTSISLPAVTNIGNMAFSECTSLTTVSLPAATEIDVGAFYKCSSLTSISLPVATKIRMQAFLECTSLDSISLPVATLIERSAFGACSSLTSISLPAATSIGRTALAKCTSLTTVSLPAATSIGDSVFYDCMLLSSIDFGDAPRPSVPTLGTNVFYNVSTTCKIIVPDAQYDEWTAPTIPDPENEGDTLPNPWYDLVTAGYKFLRHSEWEYARKYELYGKINSIVTILWSDIKNLRDNGNLIPGQQYRITDYVATSNGDMESQSANHPFDIIVTADDERTLNEHARAIIHEGDLSDDIVDGESRTKYFAGCDLAAWVVWYCLDNDTNRFAWADTTNGKGVVYRLVDEFQNDVPYDFKGIQFKAYGDTDNVWRYTFDGGEASNNTDLSMFWVASVYQNTISPYNYGQWRLNRIVFKGLNCQSNKFNPNCHSNTFGSYCYRNTFDAYCESNTFGAGCYSNTFGSDCHSNTFGTDCRYIKFGNGSVAKSFCRYIRVGSGNQYLYINPTGTTSFSEYYQNVEIKEGVNNTTTYKTIDDPNVGQTFLTTYKPANSQEISL